MHSEGHASKTHLDYFSDANENVVGSLSYGLLLIVGCGLMVTSSSAHMTKHLDFAR